LQRDQLHMQRCKQRNAPETNLGVKGGVRVHACKVVWRCGRSWLGVDPLVS
jgi:hypothetical protein